MRLNKNNLFILLCLLNGFKSAKEIEQKTSIHIRSVQRSLIRLTDMNMITRHGVNNPIYKLNYSQIVLQPIRSDIFDTTDRPESNLSFSFFKLAFKN